MHARLLQYLSSRILPEECAYHSMIVNARHLRVCKNNLRYIDWSNNRHVTGHPRELTAEDLENAQKSGAHFARKLSANSAFVAEFNKSLGI
jgi:hypothetical protein